MKDTITSLQQKIKDLEERNQAYHESQLRFSTVFEQSRLGNKIIGADLKILEVNPAMVALLGYDRKDELIGTKILNYAPADHHKDWAFLQEKLWKHLTPSFSLETRLIKKDGTIIWCQVTSILFPDKGETLGYTIIEDITEKYNLRLQKEEFISVASHELKTPITSLKATLQLINRILEKDMPEKPELLKLARSAEKNTIKLVHLVDDLLSTTKIEQGQLALNKTLFTISDVIDGCCSHIELAGRYHINYQGDHDLKVNADQHKIDQVMINLVNNAVKYAPESEEIRVLVERLEGGLKVSVTDQGKGIPPETLPHIFERYYRVGGDSQKISGLGLGLYISSEIIRRHGGEIGVESPPGQGATFWFTLPDNG